LPLLLLGLVALLGALLPASAFAEGGKTIATAPPVVYGQQEFGNTALGQKLPSSCFFGFENYYDQFWALNAQAGDVVTIDWSGVEATTLRLYAVGTTDYTVFSETTSPVEEQELNTNASNQLTYTVPVSGTMPLEFAVCEESSSEPPGPYNFTATVQHGLAVSLTPPPTIQTNSTISGSVHLISGAPVPDGLAFTLSVAGQFGTASYTATTSGGALSFPLALPASAAGQEVKMTISRPADAEYAAVKSSEVTATVAAPSPAPAPVPPVVHHRRKPLKCHRHFKKRKVHGKARCVRVHSHRHRHGQHQGR
jgi:hypothetical protein